LFYSIPLGVYADGMKIDSAGNLFCTGPTGVWIISPAGEYLDKIAMPQGAANPSNCNWGDAVRKTLYITAGNRVYSSMHHHRRNPGQCRPRRFPWRPG
jgi:sugar lactone lactonase YvrE